MSAPPKRGPHEEGVHSSSSSMCPGFGGEEENTGVPRVNYGAVLESRPGLLPRPESRDGERRSFLHSVYKMLASVTDTPHPSHPVMGPEIRTETRDHKDVRENKGVKSDRDVKVETREVHHQAMKAEECMVDDSKEVKNDKEGRKDSKSELNVEKDVYGAVGSHSSWKEQHRMKKHSDVPGGGSGMSNFWMGPPAVRKYDAVKHATPAFLRKETDEAVGENRVDLKGDKERNRKEGKHHDWPESDKDRSDHKSNVHVVSSSNNIDLKEVTREDKESEQWGRERKDVLKEKERAEEREKDHVDREGQSGGEKESYQNEKEMADKASVQENLGLEQKKPSEYGETWKKKLKRGGEREMVIWREKGLRNAVGVLIKSQMKEVIMLMWLWIETKIPLIMQCSRKRGCFAQEAAPRLIVTGVLSLVVKTERGKSCPLYNQMLLSCSFYYELLLLTGVALVLDLDAI